MVNNRSIVEIYSVIKNLEYSKALDEVSKTMRHSLDMKQELEKTRVKNNANEKGLTRIIVGKEAQFVKVDRAIVTIMRDFQKMRGLTISELLHKNIYFLNDFAQSLDMEVERKTFVKDNVKNTTYLDKWSLGEIIDKVNELNYAIIEYEDIEQYIENGKANEKKVKQFAYISLNENGEVEMSDNLKELIPHFNNEKWTLAKRKIFNVLYPIQK